MQSMSVIYAITGFPLPYVATQAVGFDFLKSQFAVAEDLVHHLLRERLHSVHFADRFLLECRQFRGLLREEKARQKKRASEPCDSKQFVHGTSSASELRGDDIAIAHQTANPIPCLLPDNGSLVRLPQH
jgi:hypothetical protein